MPRFAANLTMMFNEVPFLDRFAAAASGAAPQIRQGPLALCQRIAAKNRE